MAAVRVGVLGAGAMGRNHVRVLAAMERGARGARGAGGATGAGEAAQAKGAGEEGGAAVELAGVCDTRREVAEAVAAEHGTRVFADVAALAAAVDAVVLAVPTVLHAEIGCDLLARGLHLLVEKPLAASLEEADRLIAAAAACKAGRRVLAVGHVEFFNPAVAALLAVGVPPRFVEVQRLAVFTPRSLDVDVVLDLMIHDLQILHALDRSPVEEVRATGVPVLSPHTDIANVRIALASGCVANLTASRVSAERVRKLRTFLPSRYYSIDYVAQEIHGYRLEEHEGGRRIVPDHLAVVRAEPLRRELESFVDACRRGVEGGNAGNAGNAGDTGGVGGAVVIDSGTAGAVLDNGGAEAAAIGSGAVAAAIGGGAGAAGTGGGEGAAGSGAVAMVGSGAVAMVGSGAVAMVGGGAVAPVVSGAAARQALATALAVTEAIAQGLRR
jgi:predicted dehydrogenase